MTTIRSIKKEKNALPLSFARQICEQTNLWDSSKEDVWELESEQSAKLKNFQQMAISCTFDDSLIAYYGNELNESQTDGLRIIHKATKAWLKGEVVGVLLEKISSDKMANKDFAASVSIIIDQLMNDGLDGSSTQSGRKELVVRLSNMEDVVSLRKS